MKRPRSNAMIYPLSADPKLEEKNVRGLEHYYAHLRAAFKNERIWNIGISGTRGIGKSSLLASFDRSRFWHFRRQMYLYVSLGEYANSGDALPAAVAEPTTAICDAATSTAEQGTGTIQQEGLHAKKGSKTSQDNQSTVQQKTIQDLNAIEKRIMLQLCSRFKDKYLLGIHSIPEPSLIAAALFTVFVLCIVVLLLKPLLSDLLTDIYPQLPSLIQEFVNHHDLIEASMYALILTIGGLGLACAYKWWSTRIVGVKLAIKAVDAEVEVNGNPQTQDYLDQCAQELVYCLCSIRRKIDYTVVFEDLDRLDTAFCIPIFTRLRELNHMVNARLQQNRILPMVGGQRIRFVYLVDDHIVNAMVYHKFFDYLLPIAPTLNANSFSAIFREKLEVLNEGLIRECCVVDCGGKTTFSMRIAGVFSKVNVWMKDRKPAWIAGFLSKVAKWIEDKKPAWITEFFNKVTGLLALASERYNDAVGQLLKAKQRLEHLRSKSIELSNHVVPILNTPLVDYRMIYTILNEYALMVKLYWTNNSSEENKPDFAECSQRVLAFTVYKHLYPEDYQKALRMDECMLLRGAVTNIADEKMNYLNELLKNGILTIRSLHYAGFPKEKCRELWQKQFTISRKNVDVERMKTLIRALVKDDPLDIEMVKVACKACGTTDIDLPVDVLVDAVSIVYAGDDSSDPQDWFFVERRQQICLDVLSKLGVEGLRFIWRCKKEDIERNVFENCSEKISVFADHSLTRSQAMCYALGAAEELVNKSGITLKGETLTTRFSTLKDETIAVMNG